MSTSDLSQKEVIKRAFKYFIIFVVIALTAKYLPTSANMSWNDIFIVATVGVCSMVILDMYCPTLKINKKPIENNPEMYE